MAAERGSSATSQVARMDAAHRTQTLDVLCRILRGALAAGASDLHLKRGAPPSVRIAGEICALEHPPLDEEAIELAAFALAKWAGVDAGVLTRLQCDFSSQVPDIGRFRVHVYRQSNSVAVALRVVADSIPDLAALRLPPVAKRIAALERGLVIVTGATGNGKSTTIASLLDYMGRTTSRRVVSVEDPIEYVFADSRSTFAQREVGRDVESARAGLEGALREDPDVMFISELRSFEEFDTALHAAESGRLVVSTFHAADVVRAVQRMVYFYPLDHRDAARFRIADALVAVMAQKLLPRRGSRERILATEVLMRTPTVQDCIRDPARVRGLHAALEAGTHEFGTHTFDQQLAAMVRDGLVSLETAKAAANSPGDLVRSLSLSR